MKNPHRERAIDPTALGSIIRDKLEIDAENTKKFEPIVWKGTGLQHENFNAKNYSSALNLHLLLVPIAIEISLFKLKIISHFVLLEIDMKDSSAIIHDSKGYFGAIFTRLILWWYNFKNLVSALSNKADCGEIKHFTYHAIGQQGFFNNTDCGVYTFKNLIKRNNGDEIDPHDKITEEELALCNQWSLKALDDKKEQENPSIISLD
jgi:hypothetical protein